MHRILYYIFIYNILFEGVFEGRKPYPTSLQRGENVASLSDAEDERRETAGKQPKEGIPPEVNSQRMPDNIRRNYQEREPASNAGLTQICTKNEKCNGKEKSVNVRRSLRTKDLHPISANGAHKASMNSRIVPP